MERKVLSQIATLRVISGILEISAALVIIRLRRIEAALRINALLGLIGPLVFLAVSALGIVALAVKISPVKIILLLAGAFFILWGTRG
ncbi:MAG: DUF2619 domain-containing protein [Firmicutes bacterium]|jgi:hypothetical protein|nr:DUF2619 domain-containing protein [Bacillota bacterium]